MTFKVGDTVRRIAACGTEKVWSVGYEFEICSFRSTEKYAVDAKSYGHSLDALELVTPKYRHGDVYELKDSQIANRTTVITRNGKCWMSFNDGDGYACVYKIASDNEGSGRPDKHCGKFLYNILDKESADSDCEAKTDVPVTISVDLASDTDTTAYYTWHHATGCNAKEGNTKEALMPLSIVKNTTKELPAGESVDTHKVNGMSFEDMSDEKAIELIETANEEISNKEDQAKRSGSVRIKDQATEMRKVRKVLVGLLDAREES